MTTMKNGIQVDQRNRNGWYVFRFGSSISQFASCVSKFGMVCKYSYVENKQYRWFVMSNMLKGPTKPRIATNGAHDPKEKIHEPYRTIQIILHALYESSIRGVSGQEIRTCQLGSELRPYLTKVLPHHYISMLYRPNLTYKIAIPYVCLKKIPCLRTSRTQLPEWTM